MFSKLIRYHLDDNNEIWMMFSAIFGLVLSITGMMVMTDKHVISSLSMILIYVSTMITMFFLTGLDKYDDKFDRALALGSSVLWPIVFSTLAIFWSGMLLVFGVRLLFEMHGKIQNISLPKPTKTKPCLKEEDVPSAGVYRDAAKPCKTCGKI